jgi:phenylalanine-4-hydroxylase
LLASKRFPVATFIRTPEELDYLQEPDIFHEIFGHCPLLTNPWFAEFTHTYGKLGLAATKEQRVYLARLYWMTIEFGLMETPQGAHLRRRHPVVAERDRLQPVGEPEHQAFDPLEAMRTPYRIDILQPCTSSCRTSSACSTWPTKTSWAWSTSHAAGPARTEISTQGRCLSDLAPTTKPENTS